MRRKYDERNKRNFVIILILSIAVIGIFSLFIHKYRSASRIEYVIDTGSIVQDVNKNYIDIEDDAILRIRWNDNYYLLYQGKKINLGKKVIVYNTITNSMKLYGTFYEIKENGKIVDHKKETVLKNTTDAKFYKLDDREYLLVDKMIVSDDRSINASDYLLVELDRLGNAKLSNHKLNLKTISPTTLITSKYTFDIANEILNFGKKDIDLKKIIGSTNQYTASEKEKNSSDKNKDGTGSENDSTVGQNTGFENTTVAGQGGAGQGNVVNNTDIGNATSMGEIKDKTKMTSVIRVAEGLSQIDIDYVVYDPYNEYKSVYIEVIKAGEIDVIHLSKNDTHVLINNLSANTEYKLNFIYTTENATTGTAVPHTFDSMILKTKKPNYSISVYKLSKVSNILTYKVNLQSGFTINRVNVKLSFNYTQTDNESGLSVVKNAVLTGGVNVNNAESSVMGSFDISGYDIGQDTLLRLEVVDVSGPYGTLPVGSTYTFRFGGKYEKDN